MKLFLELLFALLPETSSPSMADTRDLAEIPGNGLPLQMGGCGRGDYDPLLPRAKPAEPSPEFVLWVLMLSAGAVLVGAVCAVLAVWMRMA